MGKVLVIDDHRISAEMMGKVLSDAGFEVTLSFDGQQALEIACGNEFDLVLTDLRMPRVDGLQILQAVKERFPLTQVIVITAYGSIETAVKAIRAGAYDFVSKPVKVEEIEITARNALGFRELVCETRKLRMERDYLAEVEAKPFGEMKGKSKRILDVLDQVRRVAPTNAAVLILGESGTGKELVARAIHRLSPRRNGPFVVVNCAAFAPGVLESELFGHERGAFTGAQSQRAGRFELADAGTIFFDEIGETTLSAQVKLLRVLQEKEFERVGSVRPIKVDCRIVAATNRNIEEAVRNGEFREDLYYRLNVVPIRLPPLREHKEDIPILVAHFLEKLASETGKRIETVHPEVLDAFCRYDWPGNVREMQNVIERLVVLSRGDTLSAEDLPGRILRPQAAGSLTLPEGDLNMVEFVEQIERRLIERAVARCGGVKSRAAASLGIERNVLRYKLKKYGLE